MDPYKVLGIDRSASDDEVKAAYRDLVRKYHPDNYQNNPLADLAEERMKEINIAYDEILKMRAGGPNGAPNGNGTGGASRTYDGTAYNPLYATVRRYIQGGNFAAAEALLNEVQVHDAEWHFLMGMIYYNRGWFQQAQQMLTQASAMDPNNREYKEALNRILRRPVYRRSAGGTNVSGCDICTTLLCADCCCECMGGDLIRCC